MKLTQKSLTLDQKVFIIKNYYWNHADVVDIREEFQRTFNTTTNQTIYKTFHLLVNTFERTGNIMEPFSYYECRETGDKKGEEVIIEEGRQDVNEDINGLKVIMEVELNEGEENTEYVLVELQGDVDKEEVVVQEEVEQVAEAKTRPKRKSKANLKRICEVCGVVVSVDYYYIHMQKHKDLKFECQICNKVFDTNRYLQRHQALHVVNKTIQNHVCDICGHNSNSRENHKRHMMVHSERKPYVCEVCGKPFARSHNLSAHFRIHTGEKPYTCKYCKKSFSTHTSFQIHTRIHTGERPYECQYCDKKFIGSSARNVHLKMSHNREEYNEICYVCQKRFKNEKVLKDHLKLKHNVIGDDGYVQTDSVKTVSLVF